MLMLTHFLVFAGNLNLLQVTQNSASCPVSVSSVVNGIGPDKCPNTTTGLCEQYLSDLSGGAPYTYYINNLVPGHPYYVQVSAHNRIGYGYPAVTTPRSSE